MSTCILVATDGTPGALGALRLARLLAERDGSRVEVVAVFQPVELYGYGAIGTAGDSPTALFEDVAESLQRRVTEQLAEIGVGSREDWSVRVTTGAVAPRIVGIAAEVGARAILLGLNEEAHGLRFLARETVLRVVRLAHIPVVAFPRDASALPSRALVAVDASAFSLRAAEHVRSFVGRDAELHLAHVVRGYSLAEGADTEWMKSYRAGVEHQLAELASELAVPASLRVTAHVLEGGEPARELLELADAIDAELIAMGSHGLGFLGRIFLGSVSSKLVRGARCGVLIAPPTDAPPEGLTGISEGVMVESLGRPGEHGAAPAGGATGATAV
jgi:nucleotide-binding universal stress UspA family protein